MVAYSSVRTKSDLISFDIGVCQKRRWLLLTLSSINMETAAETNDFVVEPVKKSVLGVIGSSGNDAWP